MSVRFKLISLLASLTLCFVTVTFGKIRAKQGPSGMGHNDTTSCVEFAKFARFNPYSVLLEKWFVFYYWAEPQPLTIYIFTFPTANHTKYLKKILNGNTILPVDWSARQILMDDERNETVLLVERSDRGEYWLYPLYKVTKGMKIRPRDIRLKQTGDNRLLGLMDCDRETLFVMSRLNNVPPKNRLQEEAARLGYRGRRGKSYLYQGHEWMPIPEDDDQHYWERDKKSKSLEKSSKEADLNESSEEEAANKGEEEGNSINEQMKSEVRSKKVKRESRNDQVTHDAGNSQCSKEQIDSQETHFVNTVQHVESSSNERMNDLTKEADKIQVNDQETGPVEIQMMNVTANQ